MLPAKTYLDNPAAALQKILVKLIYCKLLDIVLSPDQQSIRLDVDVNYQTHLPLLTNLIRIVLTGNPDWHYRSYTQMAAIRQKITEPKSILKMELELQGTQISGSQSLILFCRSPQQIAAGELHLAFTRFNLYDEAYGAISPETFY